MNYPLSENVRSAWEDAFDAEPFMVRSPGRVNLIGEHTDYNEGYVFPAAIDRHIISAMGRTGSDYCRIISLDTGRELEFSVRDPPFRFPAGSWENYVIGVAAVLKSVGCAVGGFSMVFSGDIPQGAGLSSSAALENAVVFGLDRLFGLGLDKTDMIRIAQRAEHEFAGVRCGIMDQYASMFGRAGHALLLDCRSVRSLEKPVAIDGWEWVLVNSNVAHNLAESGYNERREECETGLEIIREVYPDIRALRDIGLQQLEMIVDHFPPVIYDRCSYVVRENARVIQAVLALETGDLPALGAILKEAHSDMRFAYEITCPEIDFLTDAAAGHEDVLGSRMTGGGFGGCTLNLVRGGCADEVFDDAFRKLYRSRFGKELDVYRVELVDGTGVIN